MHTFLLLSALAGTLLLAPTSASAQSMRCKNEIVSVGETRGTVLLKCGEPVVKDSFCRPLAAPSPASDARRPRLGACEDVDEWIYKPGYGQFVTTLRFESGRLAAVTYGERIQGSMSR